MSVRALSGASPRLVTWGSGSFGAVGDGTYQTRTVPAVVELPDPVTHAHASRTPQARRRSVYVLRCCYLRPLSLPSRLHPLSLLACLRSLFVLSAPLPRSPLLLTKL